MHPWLHVTLLAIHFEYDGQPDLFLCIRRVPFVYRILDLAFRLDP